LRAGVLEGYCNTADRIRLIAFGEPFSSKATAMW
jgi:hypothetical protein